jgi:hypothetical protein
VTCGDGGYTAIDNNAPSTMYATCQEVNILKSTSSGAFGSWNYAQNGIDTGDRVDFIPPLVMDPSQSSTLYFGTYRLYATTNGAESWSAISPDLTNGPSYWGVITAVAVAPTDSNTVYVGTGDSNVQVTTNALAGAGATWTNRSSGLPARVLTSLAVDPTISTTAYVTFSGFTGFGDSLGHVFKTVNGGSTWTDISANLPNTPVNSIVVYPQAPKTLFAGTDVGVFYSTNGGASWNTLVQGLPRVAVLGLTLHTASQTLRASTHGRGVWDLNISSLVSTATVTTLTSTPNPSMLGQAVTFTAKVTAASGPVPTGTVNFVRGSTAIGSGTLNGSGVASVSTASLPLGNDNITATYNGSAGDAGSSTNLVQTVHPASTATTLTSAPNPSAYGEAITFTATVSATGGGTPTGTVQFFNYGYSLGTATLVGGKATLTATGFSVNAHPITATYSGSADDSPSTSATYSQVVKVGTSTAITSSANPATYGQPITFTATVTPTTSGTPTGTVQFFNFGYLLGTATVVNGKASLTATGFSVNSHPITAVYSGDANYLTSSAPTFTEVVKAATTVTISSSANPSVSGKPITFTATVAPSGFSGVPTGTVQFFNFGYSLGTATLVNGKASLTATGFSVNTHPITASYSGDTEFLPSNAATYEQVVGK